MLKLLSHESEALVSDNLELSILLLQELSNGLLVTITELELLVNEAVVLEELSQTTLSDVLYHLLRHVGKLLLSSLLLELADSVSVSLCDVTLTDTLFEVLLALGNVSVVASLLDGSSNSLLYLLFLGLLNSYLLLLVRNLLW